MRRYLVGVERFMIFEHLLCVDAEDDQDATDKAVRMMDAVLDPSSTPTTDEKRIASIEEIRWEAD